MKTNFTPGPWGKSAVPSFSFGNIRHISAPDCESIATIHITNRMDQTTALANAALIAAAPEMFKALELFLPMTKPGARIEREALEFIHTTCKALLTKAKGGGVI